jgi:membrane protein DedA with SNARE-associated domain
METLIEILHAWTVSAGFWGVVGVAFLQEIVPPLPSTGITLSLGFLLFSGQPMTVGTFYDLFIQVGLPIAIGLTAGSVIIYYIVRWGGTALIERWGGWIGVTNDDIEKLRSKLKGHVADEVALFTLRCVPFVPSVAINAVAGLVRWNIVSFIILTFTGTIIRTMWSAAIGWQIGSALEGYTELVEKIHLWSVVALVIAAVGFIWYRRRKVRNATIADTLQN